MAHRNAVRCLPRSEANEHNTGECGAVYLIELDRIKYERVGGGLFTLTEAMRATYGSWGVRILREDGTVAVDEAGNALRVVHVSRDVSRRRVVERRPRRSVVTSHSARRY